MENLLTPEVLQQIAQTGDGYISYLYFKEILKCLTVTLIIGMTEIFIWKLIKYVD